MPTTKTRFIENATLREVLVHTPSMWGNLSPQMHVVIYPEHKDPQTGYVTPTRSFALTEELLNFHFTVIRPQEIFLTAHGNDGTDRPLPAQLEAERGTRVIPPAPNADARDEKDKLDIEGAKVRIVGS